MQYFSEEEQSCPCCGLNKVKEHPSFLSALNTVREMCGFALSVSSMTRCKKHNKEIGGAPNSAHMDGLAVDIRCVDKHVRGVIVQKAYAAGFRRIELSSVHVHLDMKENAEEMLMLKVGKEIT